MKVVIAGGTGFLGRPLCQGLVRDGHDVVVLTRSEQASVPAGVRPVAWDPKRSASPWASEIDGSGAVINLAGEPIADHRCLRPGQVRCGIHHPLTFSQRNAEFRGRARL